MTARLLPTPETLLAPQRQRAYVPRPDSVRKKPDDAVQADRNACTLLAVLSTCRLPDGVVSAEEFTDPQLRAIAEALLRGESVAALMESQPDDRGRALVGAVLGASLGPKAIPQAWLDGLTRKARILELLAELE